MAIAYDAYSKDATAAATHNTSSFSWTHTPVGTPKGILVYVLVYQSFANQVSAVTYGGVSMAQVSASPKLYDSSEDSAVHCWFLGSSIPSGPQTVAVTLTGSASHKGFCVSLTAAGNTEENTSDSIGATDTTTRTLSLNGITSFCMLGVVHNGDSATNCLPASGWTQIVEIDAGSQIEALHRYNTVGSDDITWGAVGVGTGNANRIVVAIKEAAGAAATSLFPKRAASPFIHMMVR